MRLRYSRTLATTTLANNCIRSLNYMSSPSASTISDTHHGTKTRLLSNIYDAASRYVSRLGLSSSDDEFPLPPGNSVGEYTCPVHMAVPIVASKVSLPSASGTASLLNILPAHLASLYADPSLVLRAAPSRCRVRPQPYLTSYSEYVSLIRRLRDVGMVVFKHHALVVNGVFAVVKDDNSLRLIIDARPANSCFIEPSHIDLPTPDLFARLRADPLNALWVAKVDIDNFYHRISLPPWMHDYFGLPPVRAGDLGLRSTFGDSWIYPCCTSMPMGWSHAVYAAQQAHNFILDSRTFFQPCDRVTDCSDLLINRTRHGAYIDDLIICGPDRDDVAAKQQQYMRVMTSLGLPPKASKVILPSCGGVECLGLEFNGTTHTIGLAAPKLNRLVLQTRHLMSRTVCTGIELASIVGKWSWAILCARPAFSVFSSVYRFIQCAQRRPFTIWDSVRRELHAIIGLAPLLFASLSAPWFHKTVASDASSLGLGVVASCLPNSVVSRLSAAPPISNVPVDPGPSSWSTIISHGWLRQEHINILELRAASSAVRWVLSHPSSLCRRLLLLSDSQVAVGALSKGRSSSFQVLRRLRFIASHLLAGGIQLYSRWITSTSNPADGPSRLHV